MEQLAASEQAFHEALTGLSEAQWQWQWRPAAGGWSIEQIVEHLILVEPRLLGRIQACEPGAAGAAELTDEEVVRRVSTPVQAVSAPAGVEPLGAWPAMANAAAEFTRLRAVTVAYAAGTRDELRARTMRFSPGVLDGRQVLLMIAAHTTRHVKQMAAVRASTGFPA